MDVSCGACYTILCIKAGSKQHLQVDNAAHVDYMPCALHKDTRFLILFSQQALHHSIVVVFQVMIESSDIPSHLQRAA